MEQRCSRVGWDCIISKHYPGYAFWFYIEFYDTTCGATTPKIYIEQTGFQSIASEKLFLYTFMEGLILIRDITHTLY